jgi:hypothetical protein
MINEYVENASLVFAVDNEFFGKCEEIDLIPNGRNIAVTNENKLYTSSIGCNFSYTGWSGNRSTYF